MFFFLIEGINVQMIWLYIHNENSYLLHLTQGFYTVTNLFHNEIQIMYTNNSIFVCLFYYNEVDCLHNKKSTLTL